MTLKEEIEENLQTKDPELDLGFEELNGTEPELELLKKCKHLKSLDLSFNQIQDISFLKSLTQLKSLHLSYNQIQDIFFLESLTQLKSLHLSYNQIQDIFFLESLTQLKSLHLSYNQIQDYSFLKSLTQLQILDLSQNQIQDYSFLKSLNQLQILDLSQNQIQDYSFLKSLNQLQVLGLSQNQIQDISFLQSLNQLQTLDLSQNQIQDYSFLKSLNQLQTLDLSDNQIQDYSFLKSLTQLQDLYLRRNQIQDISFLKSLTQLQDLYLRRNQIQDISFLKSLNQLQTLHLSQNQIQDISFLQPLNQLQTLHLSQNQIQDISFLKSLNQLQTLDLSDNQIQDISFLKSLNQLQTLDLSDNQIQDISLDFLSYFPKLKKLYLYDNPIQNIPEEIFNKSLENIGDVRNFLEDQKKASKPNKTLKIILIGNGSVGKIQIAKYWTEGENFVFNTQHDSTHAIVLLDKKLGDVCLQIWDFAGQDIYHATHRLFMQTNAVFFLVWDFENENQECHTWDGKSYKNEQLRYWLEYARHFGKKSPIVVLQNKVDTPEDQAKHYTLKDEKAFEAEFPILKFLQVSAQKGTGFKALESILETAFEQNEVLRQQLAIEMPTSWLEVRKIIYGIQKKGIKTLSIKVFENFCNKHGIKKSTQSLLNYLHNAGVLYYRQGYFNSQIILNQSWTIQAIYKVLDRASPHFECLQLQKGKITYRNIEKIWAENEDDEWELFIDFMLSAELCFETTKDKDGYVPLKHRSFVIPQLLPENPRAEVYFYRDEMPENKRLDYQFLPKVFIQRFIVKAGHFSEVEDMWQRGIYLQTQEGEAVVESNNDPKQPQISISASNLRIIKKIQEELSVIADEGNIKAQESDGKLSDTERYWQKKFFGLNGLHQKIKTSKPTIQKALKHLERTEYAGYIAEMEKVTPKNLRATLTALENTVIEGKVGWELQERMKGFANKVNSLLLNN